jgi:HYR domain-containing protein
VKCNPPSGALFPLGKTTVNCTATDAAGNQSSGSFTVKVTVAWTGFLAPVNADGGSRFPLGLPIALRFALTGASAPICDLPAKLFVAPLNAAGTPGTERPAAGLPPGAGSIFYFIPIINQYAMLLDTRPLSVGPWQLRVDLGDGEVHTQRVTFFRL